MKLGLVPEQLAERLALCAGAVPRGVFESWFGIMLSRTVMAATRLGVFEALADGPLTCEQVARRCGTDARASEKLLHALVGLDCLRVHGDRFSLPRGMRSWILKEGRQSCSGLVLLHYLEWHWWEHLEEFLRTGAPLRIHDTMSDEEWGLYQRGVRSGIEVYAQWISRTLRLPRTARAMLDVGGGHGYFSVALCRRHPQLRSTVLDLPQAIQHAAPLLAAEGLGDRVVHRVGDALSDDLGSNEFDLVLLASVVHHFDGDQNSQLMKRIARALRPGGQVAVWEPVRQDRRGRIRQWGALFDLYFALTSRSGAWSAAEIAGWFRDAGLEPRKPRHPPLVRDLALHTACKPP
jgi:2-polyprenyl-3-methyl-5-hydroxy-6-metoxy-1,4-benzoquinol methylase